MSFVVGHLNNFGTWAVAFAWPMLWQSSLVIGVMLLGDWTVGRKLRPAVRYLLWLVVLAKLVLPPSLALPTSVAWWVRPQGPATAHVRNAPVRVTYGPTATVTRAAAPVIVPEPARPELTTAGAAFAASTSVSIVLFALMLRRWQQMTWQTRTGPAAQIPDWLRKAVTDTACKAGVGGNVRLKLLPGQVSPALFGMFRPTILLPEPLLERLSPSRLRAVLLHELIHLRRRDVWVNCAQALLQVAYWWHPLVWVANSHLRRVREEAVDEAVMLTLRGDAGDYAPTLLEVARISFQRPLASLGLVGILESQGALRQRIERVLDFRPPRRSGITLGSLICAFAFGALALPMGQAPEQQPTPDEHKANETQSKGDQTGDASESGKKAQSLVLVQDGKLLFEMGKLDEADKKLIQALQLDPKNQAAYYYRNLVKMTQRKNETPRRLRNVTSGRQRIYSKLDHQMVQEVEFDNIPLAEVVKNLAAESKRGDPENTGINFILSEPSPTNGSDSNHIGAVKIRLRPPLARVRLADLLDAIIKTADQPIKYSIEDYAVVFAFKANEPPALYTRVIKVDPNSFAAGLRSAMGKPEGGAENAQQTLKLLREFFPSINVTLDPPKTIFWNDREGTIVVRGTLQDLDTIETAVMVLSAAPAQVNIKTRFIELSENDETAFWKKHPEARFPASGASTLQLTSEEAKKQLEEWKSDNSAEVLSQTSVTTLSGRQAQVQVVDLKTVVTYTNGPGGPLVTNTVPLGPVVDIMPTVSTDGLRCDLELKASITEFLGYDDPGGFNPGGASQPIPHFRFRQMPVTASVWDGHTLVIGGTLDENNKPADKPGDNKKRLLVFVTPTVIDRAGNRAHTDEDVEGARSLSGTPTRIWHPTVPPRPVTR